MYFQSVRVDKVTPAQIRAAKEIIPSLKIKPVLTPHDALKVAIAELTPGLTGRQYFSSERMVRRAVEGQDFSQPAHYYEADDTGWMMYLLVSGD